MSINIFEKEGKRYIDDEEILIEYECINRATILLIRMPIYSVMIYVFYVSLPKIDTFSLLWFLSILLLVCIPLWYIIRDIKNFYHEGFYLTESNFITFRGYKISLNEIYFKTGVGATESWGKSALSFYKKNSFIILCEIKNNEEFKDLIQVIFKISKNELFDVQDIEYDCKFCKFAIQQKLIEG